MPTMSIIFGRLLLAALLVTGAFFCWDVASFSTT